MAEHKLNPQIMGCTGYLHTKWCSLPSRSDLHRQPSRFGPVSLTPVPVTGTGTGNFCVLIFR